MPMISIIIPTKDRPKYLGTEVESILRNDYNDYEIIVSDNSEIVQDGEDTETVVNSFRDNRVKYYKTPRTFGLCDNFEYALSKASGEWIMMVGDKYLFYPHTLKKIAEALKKYNPEILNCRNDFMDLLNEKKNIWYGMLSKVDVDCSIKKINPLLALKSHLSFKEITCSTDKGWYLGSLYGGGVMRRDVVEKIRSYHENNRFFIGMIPDRYSAVESLCMLNSILFFDEHLLIYRGNLNSTSTNVRKGGKESLRRFLVNSREGIDFYDQLFLPNVYSSSYNWVISDYINAASNTDYSESDKVKVLKYIKKERAVALIYQDVMSKFKGNAEFQDQIQSVRAYIGSLEKKEKDTVLEMVKQMQKKSTGFAVKVKTKSFLIKLIQSKNLVFHIIGSSLLKLICRRKTFVHSLDEII